MFVSTAAREQQLVQEISQLSTALLDASTERRKLDFEIALIERMEELEWEPEDRSQPGRLLKNFERNRDLYRLDLGSERLVLGNVDFGYVRGMTVIWPITDIAFERFQESDEYDWRDIEVDDLLPAAALPARSIYISSVFNLPCKIQERPWFDVSSVEAVNGASTIAAAIDHLAAFSGEFKIEGRFLRPLPTNVDDVLPRIICEVAANDGAVGNIMARKCGFSPALSKRDKMNYLKLTLDLQEFIDQPMPSEVRRFAKVLRRALVQRKVIPSRVE